MPDKILFEQKYYYKQAFRGGASCRLGFFSGEAYRQQLVKKLVLTHNLYDPIVSEDSHVVADLRYP